MSCVMPQKINKQRHVVMRNANGLTLIEVMTAIVIVGLLATIAYSSYQSAMRKAKRTEGRAALMQLMQQQERYYSQNTAYIAFTPASTNENEKNFKWYSGDHPKTSAYEISGAACPDETIQTCVQLFAKPGTGNVNASYKDTECGTLTLSSSGVKSADANNCW
jgi:type IV pilus assembly protein PilE